MIDKLHLDDYKPKNGEDPQIFKAVYMNYVKILERNAEQLPTTSNLTIENLDKKDSIEESKDN